MLRLLAFLFLGLLCWLTPRPLHAEDQPAPTLQEAIAEAQAEFDRTPASSDPTDPDSLQALRRKRLIALEKRLQAQAMLADARAGLESLGREEERWRETAHVPSPEERRAWALSLETAEQELNRTLLRQDLLDDLADAERARLRDEERRLRQAREKAERSGPLDEVGLRLDVRELAVRAAQTQLATLEDQLSVLRTEQQLQTGRIALLRLKLQEEGAPEAPTEQDWQRRLQGLRASLEAAQARQEAAAAAVAQARTAPTPDAEIIAQRQGLLGELSLLVYLETLRVRYVEKRIQRLTPSTAPERREDQRLIATMEDFLEKIRRDIGAGYAFAKSQQLQFENDQTLRDPQVASVLAERIAALERGFILLWELNRDLRAWEGDLEQQAGQAAWGDRLRASWQLSTDWVARVWSYELFAAEDTLIVDGRKIVERRPVTVGKILQALAILVVGLMGASYVSRWLRRLLDRQQRLHFQSAQLIEKVLYAFVVVAVVVVTLITVRIPLTVFAFMGGALALGIGFGAQNLINNLISSFILLVERPIRSGDLVEIEGVRGRVEHIGSRCTRIVRIDGVDLLIPNSQFLENAVVNLTHSDGFLRQQIQVGVAYGSDTRLVAEILQACLDAHGQVLKTRAPQVYFEDFGDNALIFNCVFWVELTDNGDPRRVASDLRHMMGKRLAEAGMGIPFPQRDVHLDTARPLQVELQRRVEQQPKREA